MSGDIAAYTDESGGLIRYYDFLTMAPGSILTPMGSTDQLSDVNGNHIAFARKTGPNRSCQVFDVTTWSTVQIGPDNSGAFSTALGSDTVAFVSGDDIKVGRISNPGGALTNLSGSAALDLSPAVSPNGNAVVWQACTGLELLDPQVDLQRHVVEQLGGGRERTGREHQPGYGRHVDRLRLRPRGLGRRQ